MKKFKILSGLVVAFALCFAGTAGVTTVDARCHSGKNYCSSAKYYYHGYKAHTHNYGYCPYR